jgi:hypothetical protein
MMTLKNLLDQTSWEQVWVVMSELFPDYEDYMESFQLAYDNLKRMDQTDENIRLIIGRYEPDGLIPFYVVGFQGECPKCFSLKFAPWERWLGVKVDEVLLRQYEKLEIVAICLYDMTWAGFSSEDVVTFHKQFIKVPNGVEAIYGLVEMIEASESNLVKQKQRSNEIYEAIGLYDFDMDNFPSKNESSEYTKARLDMEVQIYCLGESELDYEVYNSKIAELRKNFQYKWPDSQNTRPLEH